MDMKKINKIINLLLVFALVMTMLPINTYAAEQIVMSASFTELKHTSVTGSHVTVADENGEKVLKFRRNYASVNTWSGGGIQLKTDDNQFYKLNTSTAYRVKFDYRVDAYSEADDAEFKDLSIIVGVSKQDEGNFTNVRSVTSRDLDGITAAHRSNETATQGQYAAVGARIKRDETDSNWHSVTAEFTTRDSLTTASGTFDILTLSVVSNKTNAGDIAVSFKNISAEQIVMPASFKELKHTSVTGSHVTVADENGEKVLKFRRNYASVNTWSGGGIQLKTDDNQFYKLNTSTAYRVKFDYRVDAYSEADDAEFKDLSIIVGVSKQDEGNFTNVRSVTSRDLDGITAAHRSNETATQGQYAAVGARIKRDETDSNWHSVTAEFTTRDSLTTASGTFDILTLSVVSNKTNAGDIAVSFKNISAEKIIPNQTVNYDFNEGGWSDTNTTNATTSNVLHTTDPQDSSNKVLKLTSAENKGYGFELAASNRTKLAPYVLLANTSYTLSFKYKVSAGSASSLLVVYLVTQVAYDQNLPKYPLWSTTPAATQTDTDWITQTITFTTTANMYYNEYRPGTSYENVVNKIYFNLDNSVQASVYIDDIVLTNNCGTRGTGEDAPINCTIDEFTHIPYSSAQRGSNKNSTGLVSSRMFSDTINENSVLGYSYSYDVQSDLVGTVNEGSGVRGEIIGTTPDQVTATALVSSDKGAIPIIQGRAYKISFRYLVTDVGQDNFVSFGLYRSLYDPTTWTARLPATSMGNYFFLSESQPFTEWRTAEYTFVADYKSNLNYKYLYLGMKGYGTVYIDDIIVKNIDHDEVETLPNINNYEFNISQGQSTITAYLGSEPNIEIPSNTIGSPVISIADFAFMGIKGAENITVPEGVISIGSWAFENIQTLKNISIPSSVTNIGKAVFSGCKMLEAINVDDQNTNYRSIDGVLYNKDVTELIAYPAGKTETSFTVPNSVIEIAENAFYGSSLKEVILPEGLNSIGKKAFMNCTGLVSISIPNTISCILSQTFRGCFSLETVIMSTNIIIEENAFKDCEKLYTVGDLNRDEIIDSNDVAVLNRYLTSCSDAVLNVFEKMASDINGDGEIDMLDAAILTRHIAKWNGYENLPNIGYETVKSSEYISSSESPELVVNLNKVKGKRIYSTRAINYDPQKEDITIILVIGQSNSTTSVGYANECIYYKTHSGTPSAEPVRPDQGTVYAGSCVTSLNDSNDLYNLCDPSLTTKTFSGYSPSIGKKISQTTGTKVVFIQCAVGATGIHEWTKNPEDYVCTCNGKPDLYRNAVNNFIKSYQALDEYYNVVNTGYIWNQGEHEEVYGKNENNTVHDAQSYYDALISLHNDITKDCDLDFGSIVIPRSYFMYNKNWASSNKDVTVFDNPMHSRCTTIARQAQYRAANDIDNLFVISNFAEQIDYTLGDPNDSIHYSQEAYNNIGNEAGDNILKYLNKKSVSSFEGITVYNSEGVILAKFDSSGNLITGSKTVTFTEDNTKLHIAIEPLGTYYTYDFTETKLSDFVDDFGNVDWDKLRGSGYESFELVINPLK